MPVNNEELNFNPSEPELLENPDSVPEALDQSPDTAESPEHSPKPHEITPEASRSRQIGATLLTKTGFEGRHDIVNSSFERARKRGEKLPGKNNERRNYAYLERLEELIDKRGSRAEKRLWEMSASRLIVDQNNITDAYWRSQEQILHENGEDRELSPAEKADKVYDIQQKQRESIKSWTDYLGSESSPFPLWFKLYAFDGASKMGVFDTEKKRFAKRDATTVAPFPRLNPAALAKVFDAVSDFYELSEKASFSDSPANDKNLETLIKSGNFNALYSRMMLETKTTVEVPTRAEDVHGEWIEYLPGDEDRLAEAAEGTPWCIASPSVGRHYLRYGEYGYDDENDASSDSKAKFILFHLDDPETNRPSSTACASIRLDETGKVAEVSGLLANRERPQELNDSLVPAVVDKLHTLPGGNDTAELLSGLEQLALLERKIKSGAEPSFEDLEFLYGVGVAHSKEEYLYDFRVEELKSLIGLQECVKAGVPLDSILETATPHTLVKNFDFLREHGYELSPNDLVDQCELSLPRECTALLEYGADPQHIFEELKEIHQRFGQDQFYDDWSYSDLSQCLEPLTQQGVDVHEICKLFGGDYLLRNFDSLARRGIELTVEDVTNGLSPESLIQSYIDRRDDMDDNQFFEQYGIGIQEIMALAFKKDPNSLIDNFGDLVAYGAQPEDFLKLDSNSIKTAFNDRVLFEDMIWSEYWDAQVVLDNCDAQTIIRELDTILDRNVDIDDVLARLSPIDIASNLEKLNDEGAGISADELIPQLSGEEILEHFDTLENNGAKIDLEALANEVGYGRLIEGLSPARRIIYLDSLVRLGMKRTVDELSPEDLDKIDTYVSLSRLRDVPEEKIFGPLSRKVFEYSRFRAKVDELDGNQPATESSPAQAPATSAQSPAASPQSHQE